MPSVLLEACNLIKDYGGQRAVDGVSFTVAEGRCFGLLGPNGAGKTTTVEMLEGITLPTSGEIRFRSAPVGRNYPQEIGLMFQSTALQDFMTVREALHTFGHLYRRHADFDELVRRCALTVFLNQYVNTLSGGQRQRVLLAIALANRPALLFLDEPTTGLDPQARRRFWELVREIKAGGSTILLTTHYLEEAHALCDEVAIMDHGRIIAQGSPAALLAAHFDESILVLPPDQAPALARAELAAQETLHGLELATRAVNETLRRLLDAGADLSGLRIRTATLEDLFLELTGQELRA